MAESSEERSRKAAKLLYLRFQAGGVESERRLFAQFYRNLFAAAPGLERHFESIDMERQYQVLNQAIHVLLEYRPDSKRARERLSEIALHHAKFELTRGDYQIFVDTLEPAVDFVWQSQEAGRAGSGVSEAKGASASVTKNVRRRAKRTGTSAVRARRLSEPSGDELPGSVAGPFVSWPIAPPPGALYNPSKEQSSRFDMTVFAFGPFRFDGDTDELEKDGRPVKLHPQPARLLDVLLSHAGELVSRETIQRALWDDDVHVDVDLGINSCVRQLRAALGDDADNPRYVQTVPRKGYRFTAPVTPPGPAGRRRYWPLIAASGVLLAAVVVNVPRQAPVPTTRPATSFAGTEAFPAFSPDGETIAFVWRKDIYVKLVEAGDPLQLTHDAGADCCPAWSPGGTEIAFLRRLKPRHFEIRSVPALGGAERQIASFKARYAGLTWSPDGDSLVYPAWDSALERDRLFSLSLSSGEERQVTFSPDDSGLHHKDPVVSPDGRSVAFLRTASILVRADLMVASLDGGGETELVSSPVPIYGFDWTPDGRSIIFSAPREQSYESRLWRISVGGGDPERLQQGENAREIAISRRGDRLAFRSYRRDYNLWTASGPAARVREPPAKLLGSTRDEYFASYSPDGSQIAFVSDREGVWELFVSDASGARQRSLARGTDHVFPSWSPTGDEIAFNSVPEGEDVPAVFVVDVRGAVPRAIQGGAPGASPVWSPTGDVIFFSSMRSGRHEIWKVPRVGGEAVQLTGQGGWLPVGVIGGRVYYTRDEDDGGRLWSASADGGDERRFEEEPLRYYPSNQTLWTIWNEQLVFVGAGDVGERTLERIDPSSRKRTLITTLPESSIPTRGLSVSADGERILFSQSDHVSHDIMLVEGFR